MDAQLKARGYVAGELTKARGWRAIFVGLRRFTAESQRLLPRGGSAAKKENGVEAAGRNQNHALFDNRCSAVNICTHSN